jgi:nitrous oxide reductase accessory protein NosL
MKKLLPLLTILLVISAVVVLFISISSKEQMVSIKKGNTKQLPLDIVKGHFNDVQCKMIIQDDKYAAQAIASNGNTWFFDDIGCLTLWLKDKDFKDNAKLYVHSIDTNRWIDAKKAYYSIDESTPMHYGFGAYEHKKGNMINFEMMSIKMLRGENLTNPKIRKQILGI